MIKNKQDLRHYLSEDRKALKIDSNTLKGFFDLHFNPRIKYHTILRKYEYYSNMGKVYFLCQLYYYYRFKKLGYKLGYSIHKNCFGPGLCICHSGTLVVNGKAKIGSNCRIHVCVNIGNMGGVPIIGDNVYIGPGVKMFGDIRIGNNVIIGANAVVNKSFPDNVVIAGVPAKIIKQKGE